MVFSPWHHAVMFGLLAKGICDHFGEAADGLLLSAVEAYGQERGRRMAARCLRSGDPIDDMASYFAYCEWSWPGSVKTPPDPGCPYVSYRILACPWHSAWKESGLAEYGYFYCRCVDQAILRGFNPALRLSLPTCLTRNERQGCAFHWESAENTPALFDRQRRLEKRLGGTQVKDFCYHTAHLYSTILRCARDLDPAAASAAEADAADAFAARYGPEALRLVRQAARQDFTVV